MLGEEIDFDDLESIYYIWSMVTKDVLNDRDFNNDILILDVSDINGLDIAIPGMDANIKRKIYNKIMVNKYIIPSFDLESFMQELDIDFNLRHLLEDYMNKCSHFLDSLINFYIPMTGNNIMFSDNDILSSEIDRGVWLKSVRFVSNDISDKILLTFSIFRRKGIL